MKKILILMLVLKMASMAYATVTYEFRDAAGLSPITVIGGPIDTDFTFFVMGTSDHGDWKLGVYATDQNPGGGKLDMTAATVYDAAGDKGSIADYISTFDGVDLIAGDDDTGTLPNQATGDWFRLDFSLTANASYGDTLYVDILDWNANYTVVSSHGLPYIPEPMTLVLLGLGALMLKKRR